MSREAWYLSWQFLQGWRHFLKPSQKAESGLGLLEQQVPYLKSSQLQHIDCLQEQDHHVCGVTLYCLLHSTHKPRLFLFCPISLLTILTCAPLASTKDARGDCHLTLEEDGSLAGQ